MEEMLTGELLQLIQQAQYQMREIQHLEQLEEALRL
jgi:hypothetical protein